MNIMDVKYPAARNPVSLYADIHNKVKFYRFGELEKGCSPKTNARRIMMLWTDVFL